MGKTGLIASMVLLAAALPLAAHSATSYEAELQPVNSKVIDGKAAGKVSFERTGSQLLVTVTTKGLEPKLMHLQHLHGSRDGMEARCAPESADANDDEFVDLIETHRYSGVTLFPLHDDPPSLEIKTDTYPTSDADGAYTYEQTVDWDELSEAVADEYDLDDLDLDRMVVYVHGVPDDFELPDSVASLPGVPAQVTLPIACAELEASEE